MNVQIVQYQVDRLRRRILQGQFEGHLGELKARSIGCNKSEMAAKLRFYRTENIRCSSPLVLIILSGFPPWQCGRGRPNIGMQRNWLFIQTNYGLFWIVASFIRLQNILHFDDIVLIEVGHAPHFFPATA